MESDTHESAKGNDLVSVERFMRSGEAGAKALLVDDKENDGAVMRLIAIDDISVRRSQQSLVPFLPKAASDWVGTIGGSAELPFFVVVSSRKGKYRLLSRIYDLGCARALGATKVWAIIARPRSQLARSCKHFDSLVIPMLVANTRVARGTILESAKTVFYGSTPSDDVLSTFIGRSRRVAYRFRKTS